MFGWLNGPGAVFKNPLPGSTNYLNAYDNKGILLRASDKPVEPKDEGAMPAPEDDAEQKPSGNGEPNIASGQPLPKESRDDLVPFPGNTQFRSEAVLSEELKDEIYRRVAIQRRSVRLVSAELGVEMARVGAVVRLKAVEESWVEKGQRLVTPYARAIMSMLPQTPYNVDAAPTPHESINDLPVHRATRSQLFLPVSESRHFTRVDAGKAFDPDLLPADERVPHPELIELEKERLASVPREERIQRQRERMDTERQRKEARETKRREVEERHVKVVIPPGARAEFRFRNVKVESVGPTGRDRNGVGARYGFPHEDRKRGQIKIPTRVE